MDNIVLFKLMILYFAFAILEVRFFLCIRKMQDLPRRKYFCPTDYDEGYFDFHCTPGGAPPPNYYQWYTICGIPFANRAEYASMLTAICVLAAVVFFQMHCRSGPEVRGDKAVAAQAPKGKKVKQK